MGIPGPAVFFTNSSILGRHPPASIAVNVPSKIPWKTAHDTYARTDCRISLPCLPYNAACTWIVHECRRTSLPYNFLQDHSYRISILTCKGRLLPSIGQGGPPDWLEGKNHPRFAPVFFPSKPCAITAKSKPRHIRNRNTGFCQVGHV